MGIFEKIFYTIISITVVVSIYLFGITSNNITNFDNVLLGTITLNSIGIGFLIASVAMIPSFSNNAFFEKLKKLGTDKKLLGLLAVAIRFLFLLSILSVILLFITSLHKIDTYIKWIFYLWVFLLTFSFLLINSVVRIFLKVVKSLQKSS